MKTSKQLKEELGKVDGQILELRNKYEGTEMTKEDRDEFDTLIERMESLSDEIVATEKREKAALEAQKRAASGAGAPVQELSKEEVRAVKEFDIVKAIFEVRDGKLEGIEKELITEGRNEASEFGAPSGANSIVIPARFMEKRATVDQGNSDIKPTFVGAYTDALRENAVYSQIPGINVYNGLTGDFKLPVTAKQSLAWATAENSAAADGGAQFTKDTLTPFRLTGYVDLSNRIRVQNGPQAMQAIMRDLGREEAEKINAAMFSTTTVTNAPTSLAATSGVLTFTEEVIYSYGVTVPKDLLSALRVVANDHGLTGNHSYVLSTELIKDVLAGVNVAGVNATVQSGGYNMYTINGMNTMFTTGATKVAGTSGDGIFGDFSRVHFGRFGGLNILVDPYTVAGNDETRLVVNTNVDWSLVQGAAFAKFTSLSA